MTIRPPFFVTRTISFATSNGRGEHRAEDADHQVEALVLQVDQRAGVAFLEAEFVSPASRARRLPASTRLRAMSTPSTSAPSFAAGSAVVPSPQPRSRTRSPGRRRSRAPALTAAAHGRCDPREVSLFPQHLVWIHPILSLTCREPKQFGRRQTTTCRPRGAISGRSANPSPDRYRFVENGSPRRPAGSQAGHGAGDDHPVTTTYAVN
jgi:hypothetical protein